MWDKNTALRQRSKSDVLGTKPGSLWQMVDNKYMVHVETQLAINTYLFHPEFLKATFQEVDHIALHAGLSQELFNYITIS